jgi:hypothetical protein
MRRRAVVGCALAMVIGGGAAAPGADKPPKPERPYVKSVQGQGARLASGRPAGNLLDVALSRRAGGGRDIVMLLKPAPPKKDPTPDSEAPVKDDCTKAPASEVDNQARLLVRLDPAGQGTFTTLRGDLPADADALAAVDLNGDGADELLIGRRGAVLVLGPDGAQPLASQVDLSLDGAVAGLVPQASGGPTRLAIPSLRGLTFFSPSASGTGWEAAGKAVLPVEASVMGAEMTVRGLPVERIGGPGPQAPLLYAAGPREYGSQRLQTLVIHPSASGTEADPLVTESWSLLPEPEEIVETSYTMLDGKVAMLAITRPGEKLSLLGEKLLRLFVLEADRSRTGRAPVFACQSRMNLWQLAHPVFTDVNRDGTADLVIGYWKGLKDSTVVLDAYLRGADGTFAKSPRSTEFDVEDGDRGMLEYGRDVTGDGLPDLIVRGQDIILVHAGQASRDGKALVAKTASLSVPGEGLFFTNDNDFDISFAPKAGAEGEGAKFKFRRQTSGDPRFVDLDGDGRDEIVVVRKGPAVNGSGVHVISLTR